MSGKNFKRTIVVAIGLLMALLLCLTAVFASGIVFVSAEEDGSFTGYSSTLSEEKLYNATNTYAYNGANPYDIGTEEYRLYEYFNVNGNPASVAISDTPQTLPADGSVTAIGARAYYWSDFGGIIELPACVTEIGAYAFCNNRNITGVVLLPQQHVGDSAFRGYNMTVYFYGTEEAWQAYCDALAAEGRTLKDLGLSSSSITVYFYSEQEPPKTADGQLYAGFYWRYVDGVPTVWKL